MGVGVGVRAGQEETEGTVSNGCKSYMWDTYYFPMQSLLFLPCFKIFHYVYVLCDKTWYPALEVMVVIEFPVRKHFPDLTSSPIFSLALSFLPKPFSPPLKYHIPSNLPISPFDWFEKPCTGKKNTWQWLKVIRDEGGIWKHPSSGPVNFKGYFDIMGR